jgi:DNA mismatch repair protein MLH1
MWNVRTMAEQLFYQLALTRFGGMSPAKLEEPIDVTRVMAHALELEELLDEEDPKVTEVSETNHDLAHQAATCLLEKADMLKEYFAMGFERQDESILLTSLPVLLDDHEPSPGGLPFFLLRLATEVDWTEEKPCFQGVCRELGIYYAQTTSDVKHTMFPAISYLLAPGNHLLDDGAVSKMTNISSLYKVFERC